ncbi:hypothetical protein L8106_08241 [Lyngbya sp. PCC 8106]|nr:hypothetical protein L8106_08241 [Lyngbya sp. PCC 8106]
MSKKSVFHGHSEQFGVLGKQTVAPKSIKA